MGKMWDLRGKKNGKRGQQKGVEEETNGEEKRKS